MLAAPVASKPARDPTKTRASMRTPDRSAPSMRHAAHAHYARDSAVGAGSDEARQQALTAQRLQHVLERSEGAPLCGGGHRRFLSGRGNQVGQQRGPGLRESGGKGWGWGGVGGGVRAQGNRSRSPCRGGRPCQQRRSEVWLWQTGQVWAQGPSHRAAEAVWPAKWSELTRQ